MPLSKSKQAEYQRERRKRLSVIPKSEQTVIPSVIPKSELTFPVFGTVKSRYWANRFFDEIGNANT